MNIINLFKNNLFRILTKKAIIIIAVVVIPVMIGVAVLFSQKMDAKAYIALVSNNAHNIPKNDKIQVDVMKEKPAASKLLLGKYAAIVEEKKDGTYEVTTIKNKADKKMVESLFKGSKILESNEIKDAKRGIGTNILGFILMIVLMQGVALITLYPEDRTLKTFRRVLTAPVSEKVYLFVQGIFTFSCICIPTYLALVITKVIFRVDIGFSYGMLAILIGTLSALSTSLALFIASVLDRDISVVASAIYTITSVLSGCFYSFTGDNKVLDTICNIFPQKAYITLSQGIENGNGILEFKGQLAYLFICIAAFWLLGSIITKGKMKEGVY